MNKKILFLTSTRADFGKLKPLIKAVEREAGFEPHIFVTGMHMLSKYGYTADEVAKCGFNNVHYYINQRASDPLDTILSNTVKGLGDYLHILRPDMIVIHGDRTEALAGVISGALNNFLVAHIEGGEVSGTIDESIRHSVSKLAHIHFVANDEAKKRLIRMGENESFIFVIGSPDIDLMMSKGLPTLEEAKRNYDITFSSGKYSLFAYHPVTTSLHNLFNEFHEIMNAICESDKNYIVIYPNNDPGSDIITEEMELHKDNPRIRIFPSIRFEYFLVFLKNCEFIIGNSSAGIREAPIYSVPTINIGSRQNNRFAYETIINVTESKDEILNAIKQIHKIKRVPSNHFGNGKSTEKFINILKGSEIWNMRLQKYFIDSAAC